MCADHLSKIRFAKWTRYGTTACGAKRTFILKPESLHRDILNAPVAGRTGHPAGTLSSEKMIWLNLWSSRPTQRENQSEHHPGRVIKRRLRQGGGAALVRLTCSYS